MKCPKCDSECTHDEVNIGVGVQFGPWQCGSCGWSEGDDLPEMKFDDDETHKESR